MSGNAIFLSIHPRYANKIFGGTKTVELRRVCPRHIAKGALVLIYVTSPVKSLVGAFKVERVVERPLQELWKMVCGRAGVTREEFNAYFEGISVGVGIFFSETWRLPQPIELQDLRERMEGFHPPQGFRYVTAAELASAQLTKVAGDRGALIQISFLGEMV